MHFGECSRALHTRCGTWYYISCAVCCSPHHAHGCSLPYISLPANIFCILNSTQSSAQTLSSIHLVYILFRSLIFFHSFISFRCSLSHIVVVCNAAIFRRQKYALDAKSKLFFFRVKLKLFRFFFNESLQFAIGIRWFFAHFYFWLKRFTAHGAQCAVSALSSWPIRLTRPSYISFIHEYAQLHLSTFALESFVCA